MAYRLRFVRFCHGFVSTIDAFRPEIAERGNRDINILFGTILVVGNATRLPRVTETSSIVATSKALNVSASRIRGFAPSVLSFVGTAIPRQCSRSFPFSFRTTATSAISFVSPALDIDGSRSKQGRPSRKRDFRLYVETPIGPREFRS